MKTLQNDKETRKIWQLLKADGSYLLRDGTKHKGISTDRKQQSQIAALGKLSAVVEKQETKAKISEHSEIAGSLKQEATSRQRKVRSTREKAQYEKQ